MISGAAAKKNRDRAHVASHGRAKHGLVFVRKEIVQRVRNSPYPISVSTDTATTKGLTHAYIGIAIHFIDPSKRELATVVLDIRQMNERHTGENIRKVVECALEESGIEKSRVLRVVTDSASNVKAAFLYVIASKPSYFQNNLASHSLKEPILRPTSS